MNIQESILDGNSKIPKYFQLKNILLQQILEKKADERFYSERELAALYKVSVFTARQALAELVKGEKLVRLHGKGTFIANHSKTIKLEDARIGLAWQEDIEVNGVVFTYEILNLMADCDRRHIHLSTFTYPRQGLRNSACLLRNMLDQKRLDALLIYCVPLDIGDIAWLQDRQVPFILAGTDLFEDNIFSVMGDVFEGIRMAMNHLAELKHTRIGLVNTAMNNYLKATAVLGYRSALDKRDIPFKPELIIDMPYGEDIDLGRFDKWVEAARPTGILTVEEVMALGVMKRLLCTGKSVPGDISVIGYSDRLPPSCYPVSLTTIDTRIRIQNQKTLDLLSDMISGKPVQQQHVKIAPELVVRSSTAVCPSFSYEQQIDHPEKYSAAAKAVTEPGYNRRQICKTPQEY
ncbi:MAG: substrate-binding domain-containing protein [Kiritimatiellae bacterium]|nr:substrate-binding domain-containing protein [Kiritimatiellia bacterium]